MKLKFENLGALSVGELELADLTVICGENNTGKTYLTYTLYGLLKTWNRHLKLPPMNLNTLSRTGITEVNLKTHIIDHAPRLLTNAVNAYCANLYQVLAATPNRFADTKLELSVNFDGVLLPEFDNSFASDQNRRIILYSKPANSSILSINAAMEGIEAKGIESTRLQFPYQTFTASIIKEICFKPVLPTPFIVSSERTGAVTFQGELNLARNRLIDYAGEISGAGNLSPSKILERVTDNVYPLPVRDNVEFLNSLAGIQTQESELLKSFPDILTDFEALVGGSIKMQNNALQFVPRAYKGVRLRMGESSSSVRSLVILGYYLKHQAKPGDLLMIDEPELNLHPANQRRLARLLVRLVNAGIKIFITTHSDYIVKELNTLIMLNSDLPQLDEVRKQWGYTIEDRLEHSRVHVYILCEDSVLKSGHTRKSKARTLCKADIHSSLGITVDSFDHTINDMNAIQEAIYYGLNNSEKA